MKGKVQTVLGPVEASDLGKTLTHEHLFLDFECARTPAQPRDHHLQDCAFTLANLGWIRQNPYSHIGNINFYDGDVMRAVEGEMALFKQHGGGTIVENTSHGINRNVTFLHHLSQTHGVHVVAGTGYYIKGAQKKETLGNKTEDIAELMRKELVDGCVDNPTIKCGIIGEIGCSWPLHEFERSTIRGAAHTQAVTGCPVMIHPGRNEKAPHEIVRVYSEAGGDVKKMVMAHLDRTIHTHDELLEFAALGTYCEFDLFGIETSHYQLNTCIDMPSDAQRIDRIKCLVDGGFGDKILIAHDIHTKHRLEAYGGHGFCHIFRNVVPKMLDRGLTQLDVDKMLISNPATWLTFDN